MFESLSDRVCLALIACQFLPFLVWGWQRRANALGGPISLVKAFWLIHAIVLWIVVPILLWRQHPGYPILAVSMLIRAVAEIPLCLTKTWKVKYGLAHDGFHLALVIGLVVWLPFDPGFSVLSALTALTLVTEIIFVRWFARATSGPETGIYFVPGGAAYQRINRLTALLFLPQYALFLGWISLNLWIDG